MSQDTFKYLNQEQQGSNAAQNFLNEKLSKNKYMSVSNPDNPYSMGEGSTPSGEAYESDLKVLNQDAIDAANKANKGIEGRTGAGKLSAEEIREKFGFTYNEAHANEKGGYSEYGGKDNGAIYDAKTGEYVGTIAGFKPQQQKSGPDEDAQGINPFEKMQDYELEHGFRDSKRSDWNSMNDVAGAVQNILGGEETKVPEAVKEEMKPIEHSAEIKQAKERVQQYETDVMSGKTSQEIYGKGEAQASDKYNFDASLGAAAIGGSPVAKTDANNAAASFLDKKVADTKKTLLPL